jgi:integration host factor subunit beta
VEVNYRLSAISNVRSENPGLSIPGFSFSTRTAALHSRISSQQDVHLFATYAKFPFAPNLHPIYNQHKHYGAFSYANFAIALPGIGKEPLMTKADLVDKVTALGDLTRRDGEVIVDTLFESVIGALKAGDKIEIRGFGSFRTRQRNARTGRNPKTGARVDVPAKRVPFFKPSKELRDSVNPSAVKSTPIKGTSDDKVDPHHPPAM